MLNGVEDIVLKYFIRFCKQIQKIHVEIVRLFVLMSYNSLTKNVLLVFVHGESYYLVLIVNRYVSKCTLGHAHFGDSDVVCMHNAFLQIKSFILGLEQARIRIQTSSLGAYTIMHISIRNRSGVIFKFTCHEEVSVRLIRIEVK